MGKRVINYGCSECGLPKPRAALVVKKVMFTEMGEGGRTLRARVSKWLCGSCLKDDEHYNMQSYKGPYKEAAEA